MLCVGQMFFAYTGAVFWPVGMSYMDENIHPKNFALGVG